MFYVKLYVHSLADKLKRFYENARCYNKIYCKREVCENVFVVKFEVLIALYIQDVVRLSMRLCSLVGSYTSVSAPATMTMDAAGPSENYEMSPP